MAPETFPSLVGRKEMAAILGVHPNNSHRNRFPDLPDSLQERYGADVVAVSVTPLWFREEIEEFAALRSVELSKHHTEAEKRSARKREQERAAKQVQTTT